MNDIYTEHIVERRRRGYEDAVRILSAALIPLSFAAAFKDVRLLGVTAAAAAVRFFLVPRLYVEYEYILTGYTLDIAAVYRRESRAEKASLDLRKAVLIAETGDASLKPYEGIKAEDYSAGIKGERTEELIIGEGRSMRRFRLSLSDELRSGMRLLTGRKCMLGRSV